MNKKDQKKHGYKITNVLLDEEDKIKLELLCKEFGISRSAIIRLGIRKMFKDENWKVEKCK